MLLTVINPEYIGIAAGVLTSISMLPQLFKMLKKKKADDVSIPMLLVLFSGIALWIYYGYLKQDLPILLTNSFSLLVNIVIIFFTFKFKQKK